MIDPEQVRALALALPEAAEAPHFEQTSFRVRGKIFAQLTADRSQAVLKLSPEHAAELVDTEAPAVTAIVWGQLKGWVRVNLAAARPGLLEQLIPIAWAGVAPRSLVKARAA